MVLSSCLKATVTVQPVHLVNVDRAPGGCQSSNQANLGYESNGRLLPSTSQSPFISINQPKSRYSFQHFTQGWRAEGWVNLCTATRVHSLCSRLYIALATVMNTTTHGKVWVLSHHTQSKALNKKNEHYYLNDWIVSQHISAACQNSSAVNVNRSLSFIDYTELSVLFQANNSLPPRNLPCWSLKCKINVYLIVFCWPPQCYLRKQQQHYSQATTPHRERVEGWLNVGTVVTVCSICRNLYTMMAVKANTHVQQCTELFNTCPWFKN